MRSDSCFSPPPAGGGTDEQNSFFMECGFITISNFLTPEQIGLHVDLLTPALLFCPVTVKVTVTKLPLLQRKQLYCYYTGTVSYYTDTVTGLDSM